MKTTTIIAIVAALLLAGPASGASMEEFEQAFAAAEQARKKAASVDGEWRDVGKFLKQARKAAEAGDMDKAMKLIAKAQSQSEAGYQQAVEQQGKDLTPSVLR